MKLALISKEADRLAKERRTWENKTENNALELENLENALKTARNMGETEQSVIKTSHISYIIPFPLSTNEFYI